MRSNATQEDDARAAQYDNKALQQRPTLLLGRVSRRIQQQNGLAVAVIFFNLVLHVNLLVGLWIWQGLLLATTTSEDTRQGRTPDPQESSSSLVQVWCGEVGDRHDKYVDTNGDAQSGQNSRSGRLVPVKSLRFSPVDLHAQVHVEGDISGDHRRDIDTVRLALV